MYGNIVITSFFYLLESFLNSINSKEIKQIFFKELFKYTIDNNENNLYIAMNFLNFIMKSQRNNYTLENEEIELLFNYYVKINSSKQIKDNIS